MSAALSMLVWAAVADPGLSFAWELPGKVVSDVAVAGEVVAGGIPVRMRKLTVKLSAAQVGAHFLASFRRQGLYVPPGLPYDRVLTGVRPRDYRTFTVLIQPIDPRHCGVILGEAMPLAARAQGGADPLFPAATHAFETRFESGRTVSFRARATEADLHSFYSEVLPKIGFARTQTGSWRSAGEELSVLSMSDPKEAGVLSVVLVRHFTSTTQRLP